MPSTLKNHPTHPCRLHEQCQTFPGISDAVLWHDRLQYRTSWQHEHRYWELGVKQLEHFRVMFIMSMFHARCNAGVWDMKTRWNAWGQCRHVALLRFELKSSFPSSSSSPSSSEIPSSLSSWSWESSSPSSSSSQEESSSSSYASSPPQGCKLMLCIHTCADCALVFHNRLREYVSVHFISNSVTLAIELS